MATVRETLQAQLDAANAKVAEIQGLLANADASVPGTLDKEAEQVKTWWQLLLSHL